MSKKLCKESMLSVLPSALSLDKNLFALASAAADELEELCSCNDSLKYIRTYLLFRKNCSISWHTIIK